MEERFRQEAVEPVKYQFVYGFRAELIAPIQPATDSKAWRRGSKFIANRPWSGRDTAADYSGTGKNGSTPGAGEGR